MLRIRNVIRGGVKVLIDMRNDDICIPTRRADENDVGHELAGGDPMYLRVRSVSWVHHQPTHD